MFEADCHLKLLPVSILDIQSVWANWYAVHGHTVAALHSCTHTPWLKFEGSWSLVESKWCQYVLVKTDSHLKLIPTSILDIKKCLNKLICCPWAYSSSLTQSYQHFLAQFLGSGSLVESKWCHHVMVGADRHLKLLPSCIVDICRCLSTLICCPWA
jgi:hypothetical protein